MAKLTLKPKWRQHGPSQNIAGDAENMIDLAPGALMLPGRAVDNDFSTISRMS